MASTILRQCELHFNFTGPIVVDLSCFAIALEIVPSTEEIDIGTFCNPSATDQGRTTYSATATLLWEPALYAALQPHIGEQFLVAFAPDANEAGDYIRFTSRYASQPWGRFEVGQRVEVELPLAVLDTPSWVDAALLAALREGERPDTLPAEPEATPQSVEPEA